MMTEQLRELAEDFGQRLCRWDWWEDALLVVGTYPKEEGADTRRIAPRVYLVGAAAEEPPMRVLSRCTRGTAEWVSIAYLDAVDLDLFSYALATKPLPRNGKHFNLLAAHFARVDDAAKGRFGFTHHPQMDTPSAEERLDDVTWVRDTLADLGLCVLP